MRNRFAGRLSMLTRHKKNVYDALDGYLSKSRYRSHSRCSSSSLCEMGSRYTPGRRIYGTVEVLRYTYVVVVEPISPDTLA